MDGNVQSVKIVTEKPMPNGCLTLQLECCSDDRKHWKSLPLYIDPGATETFFYRYVVKYKEGLVKFMANFLVSSFTGKKDDRTVQERRSRKLNVGTHQYDIFRDPNHQSRMRNVFVGQMFFVKLLFQELVSGGNLNECLMECEHVGFGHPSYTFEEVKSFLKWVQDLISNSHSPSQSVYICSLLGQFVDRGRTWSAEDTCYYLGQKTADLILSSFGVCPNMLLLQTSTKYITIVAEGLFRVGSSTGCLLFIRYFCNLLDINDVLHVADKLLLQSYTEKQFDQQVPLVLNALKSLNNPTNCAMYSSYVIRCSPSVPCLWNLYEIMSYHFPALVDSLMDEFSNIYCKFISCRRTKKPDLCQPLFWCQVPAVLKKKVANQFCKALADQTVSVTTWSCERLAGLKSIVVDANLHLSEYFHHFILRILASKCKEMASFLPDLLASETFCTYWKTSISDQEKEKVCHQWLTTNFENGGTKPKDKVLCVVEVWELLCKRDVLKTDLALSKAVDKKVEQLVLNTRLESIMDALKDAQSSTPVQQRLTLLLRSAIKRRTGTGDCRSKYRHMIHLLGLDSSKERQTKDVQKVEVNR